MVEIATLQGLIIALFKDMNLNKPVVTLGWTGIKQISLIEEALHSHTKIAQIYLNQITNKQSLYATSSYANVRK